MTRRPSLTVTSYLAPAVQPLYEAIARHLARRLGRRLTFTPAESYDRLVEDVDDIAFVCSVPYVLLTSAGSPTMVPVAAPVLTGERYAARPIYYSDVIASTASSYGSLADLRGATLAYNEVFSQSGFMLVCAHLEALGETDQFFGSLYRAGYHQEAIRMVADGRVDGAAIDSQVLAIQLRDVPELASRIRVIETLGPSAIQPVIASTRRLSSAERHVIVSVLLGLHDDVHLSTRLDEALVERFVSVDARDYAAVHSAVERVERAGLISPAWRRSWPKQPVGEFESLAGSHVAHAPEERASPGMLAG